MNRTIFLTLISLLLLSYPTTPLQQRELDRQFLEAVERRDVPKINLLVSQGANVNASEPINGHFALQYAINWPDLNLVKLLLDKGADVNKADQGGNTALTDAAGRRGPENAEIVKLLIARGADIHACDDAAILGAAKQANSDVVRLLIAKGAPVNARDKERGGNTVLMEAASGVSIETIAMLLDAGANLKATNDDGQTALMKASALDHRYNPTERLPMIELLIKKGSDINAKDKNGKTALLHSVVQYMAESGGFIAHPEVVKLLLASGADVQVTDERGDTALITTVGVWRGSPEIAHLLLDKGIDVNAQNKKGTTALMVVAGQDKRDIVELLIASGAKLNLKDNDGNTALDSAVNNGRGEIARLLFAKGGESTVYKSEAELTKASIDSALLRAASSNNLKEVNEAIAAGADLNGRTRRGETALMLAIEASYGRMQVVTLLIEKGANINAEDASGNTALMTATYRNNDEAAALLLAAKAKVYARNKEGRTAFHIAAAGLQRKFIKMLLEVKPVVTASSAGVDVRRVDVNERESSGKTPLMLAADNGSYVPDEVMEMLLSKGAEIDAQDPQGNTPLMFAAKSGSMSGVEYLLGKGASVNLKNMQGQSALTLAKTIHENQKVTRAQLVEDRIVAMLVKAGAK